MRLTDHTDYALRTLIYLAVHPDQLIKSEDIGRSYGISQNHLGKVIHRLGVEGYLEVKRGRGGGIRLSRNPSDIVIGDVVRSMEANLALVECQAEDGGACAISPACHLKGILGEASSAFFDVLDGVTLETIVLRRRKALAHLLRQA